ncbi:hypothetical protein L0664_02255 [Octadecabacter sp. G9-8]|uniref:DUF3019 domain-containing protein n=1 Tax=Octadecabacter dasysiphoniae TaxID=2909341 RepID=A0ABS9CTX9_9RHOB|nr:hypothetical protein [Octadecabacter dasysiphoniae]MCF2869880.1 hypothetical protein [Octadecabacter dasysiphoniae]
MIRLAAILAILACPVTAQSLCDVLDDLDGDILDLPQGQANCRTSLALGGTRSIHCALEFSYRSDAAVQAFDELVTQMTACIGQDATVTRDQSVNHPDAYDLRTFENGSRAYAVSIKDKGALRQTLVFVRVQRP